MAGAVLRRLGAGGVRLICLAVLLILIARAPAGRAGQEAARETVQAPQAEGELLPTGQRITPTATPGAVFQPLTPDLPDLPGFTAGQAVSLAPSPDGKLLLVLTSGFNRNYGPDGKPVPVLSNEYVFIYDI